MKDGALSTLDSPFGANRTSPSLPYMSQCPEDTGPIKVIFDPCKQSEFVKNELTGEYEPQHGSLMTLTFNGATCEFEVTECNGNLWFFSENGDFVRVQTSDGQLVTADRNEEGEIERLTRSVEVDGRSVTDSVDYERYAAGPNAGRIQSATTRRSVNPTAGIRRMVYAYYADGDEHGSAGDLKTATEQILSGTTWVDHDTSYYRYYKDGDANGFEHGLKYALGPHAFARLEEDSQVGDPFLATDAKVAQYADQYYEYNADQRVTKSVTHAGLFTYFFAYAVSGHADDPNHWKLKMVETRPDGSTLTRYNNFLGQTMLTDLAAGSAHWLEYHEFNADFRETLYALPSAVVSYDDTQADLDVVLQAGSGLIQLTNYYATTTATPTTPGGAEGHVESQQIQEGTGGTPITLGERTYFERTGASSTIYPVAESTVYRNDDGTGAITTSFAYTWFTGTTQIEQRTTTLPVVPGSQNGNDEEETVTEIFDDLGNLIWVRDPRGFITYRAYDLPTGALVQEIRDVDGAKLTLPSGWVTPDGGGLHLVSDFEIDPLGRTTQSLGPSHEVLGQSVRTASWTVYLDLADETRSGQGYALGTGPEYVFTLVNPVSIQRMSHDGRVQDSIVAVRGCVAEKPCACLAPDAGEVESPGPLSASDCFPQSSWVRWSTSRSSDEGQLTASRTYHNIPDCGPGQIGVNYDETLYGYDRMGRQNRVVAPTGTISRTMFDVRGLTVSAWIGTNDRYATDTDPTGGGAGGNNMVQTGEMAYDGGSAGGDGNLTEQTAYVDASTSRVTTYLYDFRNRRIATDGEEDFYEELTYDNLDHVIRTDRLDTDSGGNLIARSESKFDNRGRVYQTIRYAVNPSTGSVGNSLTDNNWYDAGGNVLCSLPSGSNVFSKSVYDGIGRAIIRYAGYNPDEEIIPDSVAEDLIFEQSETTYDDASNVVFATSRQRFHDATGEGPLNGPSGSQPKSRDSYSAMWQDGVGRTVASANYGTYDNAGPPDRPDTPPVSSDEVLVSQTRYNDRGEAFETVDPAGKADRTYADDAGRTVRTIQNFVAYVADC